MVKLHVRRVQAVELQDYAHWKNMAKVPDNVYKTASRNLDPGRRPGQKCGARPAIKQGRRRLPAGHVDWWYYAEKVKKARIRSPMMKKCCGHYFKLENVRQGFRPRHATLGLKFIERKDIPFIYSRRHGVRSSEADGAHVEHPRRCAALKQGGAWMSELRQQFKLAIAKTLVRWSPGIGNFSKPAGDGLADVARRVRAALFTNLDTALVCCRTPLTNRWPAHECGTRFCHSKSQIMENWATEPPQMLKRYARGTIRPAGAEYPTN